MLQSFKINFMKQVFHTQKYMQVFNKWEIIRPRQGNLHIIYKVVNTDGQHTIFTKRLGKYKLLNRIRIKLLKLFYGK